MAACKTRLAPMRQFPRLDPGREGCFPTALPASPEDGAQFGRTTDRRAFGYTPKYGGVTMLFRLFRFALASILVVPAILAQSTGTIQGSVTDPSGAPVPKAIVTVRNIATGEERSFTTDDVGLYVVPSLPAGRYQVSVKAPGLQPTTANDLVLEVGRTVQQNFHLPVATVTEAVEIVGVSPVIETSTVSVGSVVDQRTVQEIPLNGRHFVDLGTLTTGSVTPPATGYLTAPLRGQDAAE